MPANPAKTLFSPDNHSLLMMSPSSPARRAARSVLTFKIEVNWSRPTIADSSSTELSEPKASRAGLWPARWRSARHCIQRASSRSW
jgi:hypothetical protein